MAGQVSHSRGRSNWLPVDGGVGQRLVAGFYREVARRTAALLGSSEVVRSVLTHRSVATGEVTFAFSDIDFIVIARQPRSESMDGPELLDLYERLRWLKRINPRLGHLEIHDPEGFQRWFHIDTFRCSKERRSAALVYGEPVDMPEVPVRREDALRRFALWPYYFLSPAIRGRDRRNLRKIALEMWSAYATATELVDEPFLTRKATEEFCRSQPGGSTVADLRRAQSARTFLFRTAEQLHRKLLPPLAGLREPILEDIPLWPGMMRHPCVVLPRADSPLPGDRFDPGTIFLTPELLDICVQYALPHHYWYLPPAMRALGIRQPSATAFLRYARYHTHGVMLRIPGFTTDSVIHQLALSTRIQYIARHLERGEIPPRPDDAGVAPPPMSIADYYRNVFPRLMAEFRETAARLDQIPQLKE